VALSLESKDPLYRLGRVLGLVETYPSFGAADSATVDTLTTRPLAGFALLQREITARLRGKAAANVADGVAHIMAEVDEIPVGPIAIAKTSQFWMGYYHQKHGVSRKISPDELRQAGEALYGEQWQSDLARALDINPRRIREMLERGSVPPWVRAEIYGLLVAKSKVTADLAAKLAKRPPASDAVDEPRADAEESE